MCQLSAPSLAPGYICLLSGPSKPMPIKTVCIATCKALSPCLKLELPMGQSQGTITWAHNRNFCLNLDGAQQQNGVTINLWVPLTP